MNLVKKFEARKKRKKFLSEFYKYVFSKKTFKENLIIILEVFVLIFIVMLVWYLIDSPSDLSFKEWLINPQKPFLKDYILISD